MLNIGNAIVFKRAQLAIACVVYQNIDFTESGDSSFHCLLDQIHCCDIKCKRQDFIYVVAAKRFDYLRQCPSGYYYVVTRSEEHTSELQSRPHLVCRLLLEKK